MAALREYPLSEEQFAERIETVKDNEKELLDFIDMIGSQVFRYALAETMIFDETISFEVRNKLVGHYVCRTGNYAVIDRLFRLPPGKEADQIKRTVMKRALEPGRQTRGVRVEDVEALLRRAEDSEEVLDLARMFVKRRTEGK